MHDCSELHINPMADVIQQFVNGQKSCALNIQDRGLSYGHGVFETIKISAYKPLLLEAHLQRLLASCERIKISTEGLLANLEDDLALITPLESGVLKIIVTAGIGGRGYQLPADPSPTRIVQLLPFPTYPDQPAVKGITARWCNVQLSSAPLLAGIKHLNRLEQVLARAEWTDISIREGILCGDDGYIAEGTMSNIFIVKDNILKTPNLQNYGVEGIMRNHLIDLARSINLCVEVCGLTKNDLLAADEVFFCNSLIEVWPLHQLEQQRFEVGQITRKLQHLLINE